MTEGKKGSDDGDEISAKEALEEFLATPEGQEMERNLERDIAAIIDPSMTQPQAEVAWALANAFGHKWPKVWTAERAVGERYSDLAIEVMYAILQQKHPLLVIPEEDSNERLTLLAIQAIGQEGVDEALMAVRAEFHFLEDPYHEILQGRDDMHKWLVYRNGDFAIYVRRGNSAIASFRKNGLLKVVVGSQFHGVRHGAEYRFTQEVDADAEKELTRSEWETQVMLMAALGYTPAQVEIQLSTGKTTLAGILGMA